MKLERNSTVALANVPSGTPEWPWHVGSRPGCHIQERSVIYAKTPNGVFTDIALPRFEAQRGDVDNLNENLSEGPDFAGYDVDDLWHACNTGRPRWQLARQ
jgi:hypothetical protein